MDIEEREEATRERRVFTKEIEELLEKERLYRQNNEYNASTVILPQIIELAYNTASLDEVEELLRVLIKKRGQPVKAQVEMVRKAMGYVEKITDKTQKMKYVKCIREVSDKKIYLEVEFARCVLMIVKNEETASNIEEAAKILQDVQVETYGSMDHREKIEFILYQMKIMVKKDDMIRLLIVSRKVTDKTFKGQKIEDLRAEYYSYLLIYQRYEQNYKECARCFKSIVDSIQTQAPEIANLPSHNEFGFSFNLDSVFENWIFFTAITEQSPEKIKALAEIKSDYLTLLERKANLERLVNGLLSKELVSTAVDSWGIDGCEIFKADYPHSADHRVNFKKQLIQHNVVVCSKYYERVRIARLAQLTGVSTDEVEEEACHLLNSDLVSGKIDRVEGVIVFRRKRTDDAVLDDWVQDVNSLLELVNNTCNLIDREEEVAG